MKYERFTEKRKGKNVIPLRKAVCGVGLPKWSIDQHSDIESFLRGDAVDRLAELEDKIEQGYIKILPVKEGDKIYVVPSKVNFDLNKLNGYSEHNRVYEQTVDEIRFFRKDIYMVFSCDYLENHRGASLGETWFLTREEAEKRLKEVQGC